jgi:hypothetical protein
MRMQADPNKNEFLGDPDGCARYNGVFGVLAIVVESPASLWVSCLVSTGAVVAVSAR